MRTGLPGGLSSAEAERRLCDLGPNLPPIAVRQSLASRVGPIALALVVAAVPGLVLRVWLRDTLARR